MGLIEVILRYVMEMVKLCLANEIVCRKKQRYGVLAAGLAVNVAVWFLMSGYGSRLLLRMIFYGLILAFLFASVCGTVREKTGVLLQTWLVSVVCDGMAGLIAGRWIAPRVVSEGQMIRDYVTQSLLVILCLCLFFLVREMMASNVKRRLSGLFENGVPGVIAAAVILLLVILEILELYRETVTNDDWRKLLGLVREGGAVGAGILGLLFLSMKSANDRLKTIRRQQQAYARQQREYYELMLKTEEDTRKYRHDMKRHLMNLYALQEEGARERVQEYLKDLAGEFEEIQNRVYVTGNDVMDILTNAYLSRLGKEVEITFSHQFQAKLQISDMDLCTIYGNLLENAVEELSRDRAGENIGKKPGERKLRVQINCGQFWFYFSIGNSVTDYQGATKKEDKRNHGLGLQNVKKTVERLEGNYQVLVEDGMYQVEVTLPNTGKE